MQDAERLAQELQKYPCLYEKGNKGHKERERDRKETAWRAVEQFLMVFLWAIRDQAIPWKAVTFFFITFAKNFIIQITWNMILYHWPSPSISYGKFLVLFFFKIFFAPTFFSFFLWFAPDGSLRENSKTLTAPLHLINQF